MICLICARGGSKGLRNKNIRLFGGEPLIGWAIKIAKQFFSDEKIIVSTDSNEIARIAEEYGATVPFIRPDELAMDNSPEWLVWRHAINFLEKSGLSFNSILSLPATSPLRSCEDVKNCIDLFSKDIYDAVITVTSAHRNPYFNMVKKSKDFYELVINNDDGNKFVRRQDAPEVFDMTTVAYVVKKELVMNSSGIFDGKVGAVQVPLDRSLDIDSMEDFLYGEYLLSRKGA